MRISFLWLSSLFLICACGGFKKGLVQIGGQEQAARNAILDFSSTSGFYKTDSVFSVKIHEPLYRMVLEDTNDGNGKWVEGDPYIGVIAVSISVDYDKMLLTDSVEVGKKGVTMPTRYLEKDGKLFYWWDDSYPLTQETLTVFEKYNLVAENNLDGVIEFYDYTIDDAQKGIDYYFCGNDLTKYKKVTTNKGIGFYDAPLPNCNSQ